MNNKFAILVQELELAGAVGHEAYELANLVDSSQVNCASHEQIRNIAIELLAQEKATQEAISIKYQQ